MIPVAEIETWIESPLPSCPLPEEDEISEEGFGYFRDTWLIGEVSLGEAVDMVRAERRVLDWLDAASASSEEFEGLATAIEHADVAGLEYPLKARALRNGVRALVPSDSDPSPLDGLEVGVAGLTYALSYFGCLTAASCRWHMERRTWSNCPVVLFAAPDEVVSRLAGPVSEAGCGLDLEPTRGLMRIFAPSVRETHRLADAIVARPGAALR